MMLLNKVYLKKTEFYLRQIEDYTPGTASQKALRTAPLIRYKSTVVSVFETEGCTFYAIQIYPYRVGDGSWWPLTRLRRKVIS